MPFVKKLKLVQNTVRNCPVAKTCGKHRAQLACCSKLSSKHSAHLSFCFKLAHIVRKPRPVKNAGHNFSVAQNLPQITLPNSRFVWNWATFLNKPTLVQNTVRNRAVARNWPQVTLRDCGFAWNWAVLLGSQSLWKTPGTTFVLLEFRPKSHCATVVLLQIGPSC